MSNAAILFPERNTLVAQIFFDPILRGLGSENILDIIIPKGIDPIKYPNTAPIMNGQP